MKTLYLLSVWLHILAAAIWIGGMVFLVLVLVPVVRRPENVGRAGALLHRTGVRFSMVGWICLGLLVVSGAFNLAYRGFGWVDLWNGRLWQGPFGQALAIKLTLVSAIFLLSGLHDFVLGPQATAALQTNRDHQQAQALRRRASWLGRINLLLGLSALFLATMLVRGWP